MIKKQLTLAIVLLAAILALTACGSGGDGPGVEDDAVLGTIFTEYAYVPSIVNLTDAPEQIQGTMVHGDRIFYYYIDYPMIEMDDEEEIDWETWQPPTPEIVVGSIYADGSDPQGIRFMAPGTSIELADMTVTDRGTIAMLMSNQEWSDFGADTTIFYLEYDMDGNQISAREIDGVVPANSNWFHMSNAVLLSGGGAVLSANSDGGEQIFLLDENQTLVGQLDMSNWVRSIVELEDGRVLALSSSWDMNTQTETSILQEIDMAAGVWGEEQPFNMANAHQMFPAQGESEFDLYISDMNHLFGYRLDTGERELVLNWIESGIASDGGSHVGLLPDGRISVFTMDWGVMTRGNMSVSRSVVGGHGGGAQAELTLLTRTPRASLPEREVITLGGLRIHGEVSRQVVAFNRMSQTHQIQVQDFTMYDTNDDAGAGRTRFLAAMGAGHGPDIVWGNLADLFPLADRGLLADLYSYMDADPEIDRTDFLTNILQALESEDATLPLIGNSFGISTMVGRADATPEMADWDLGALLDIIEQAPPHSYPMGDWLESEAFLAAMLLSSGDEFINWTDGTAHLDSEAFINLLEIAYHLPHEIDWDNMDWTTHVDEHTRMLEGDQLVMGAQIWSADSSMQIYSALGDIRFLGIPTSQGGAHVIHIDQGFGINSGSDNQDAAWAFVRQFLQTDSHIEWQLPVRVDKFEATIEEAMTPEFFIDEDGNEVEQSRGGLGFGSGFVIDLYAMTEEEAATLREIATTASLLNRGEESVSDMITEELLPFLAGDRNAADTARILQNRITTFLRERS